MNYPSELTAEQATTLNNILDQQIQSLKEEYIF